MHTNRLAREKSPYLLQHAHNPVDWHPWGPEAFEKARREDKPIFLSVGYSTCHWCHVMERESFEDERTAELLNREFVPVKVDREERPDVDRIYMTFVQAATGSGGWPMSVWLTPDLKPFFGGTYFPPEDRYGRAGFRNVLGRIAEAWRNARTRILESSEQVLSELKRGLAEAESGSRFLDEGPLESGYLIFRRMFDPRLGGFGGAPKFPRPSAFDFLLREYSRTGNREALEMVLVTLRAMAKGGMNDQLGGGFHRYSVDERWFVPHFEKMLYDQAQLAVSYLEAFQITKDEFFAGVARDIFEYVLRDMTAPEGGFYSAEDADSAVDPARPDVKAEGAFYLWTREEIETVLGQPAAEWFCRRFGVERNGNVRDDPHGEFTGKNILYVADDAEIPDAELAAARQKLLAARALRMRPHLDDKILTAWNGLMISAFALGAQVLEEKRYEEAARRSADFILARLYDPNSGTLLRRYRQGEAAIAGFLDDYAFFAKGLLDLYETCFEAGYLETALRLTEKQRELFEDPEQGGFFSTSADDGALVLRMKDDYDGAEPSGNSIAVMNLLRLAEVTGRQELRDSAERALGVFAPRLRGAPAGMPAMLVALGWRLGKPKQIVLAGETSDEGFTAMLREVRRRFLPHKVVLAAGSAGRWRPEIAGMTQIEGKRAAYVCEDFVCRRPVTEPAELAGLLE